MKFPLTIASNGHDIRPLTFTRTSLSFGILQIPLVVHSVAVAVTVTTTLLLLLQCIRPFTYDVPDVELQYRLVLLVTLYAMVVSMSGLSCIIST